MYAVNRTKKRRGEKKASPKQQKKNKKETTRANKQTYPTGNVRYVAEGNVLILC